MNEGSGPATNWLALLAAESSTYSTNSAADELRQALAGIQSLADNLPLNLLVKDVSSRRVFANRRYLELHSTTLGDLFGKTDYDLFPKHLAAKFIADDQEILRTGKVLHDTEEHVGPDGRQRWIERIKAPLRDADGDIVGVQVLFWDITEQHEADLQLERERYLLQSLMDNIPDAIYFKDRESRFLRVSRSQARKFGLPTPEAAVGKTDADIFTAEHALQALADERTIMQTAQPIVASVEKETWPDRDDTWVSTTKMPLCNSRGEIVGTFGISRDVTELKQTQVELSEARDVADAASRAKSEFLANMSHEIRTPMNAIIGMTELLLDTELSPTQRDYLRMVEESGEALLVLLNDILDFSKIEAGRLELDHAPFDVRECLGDTMKSLALRAHRKGLELAVSIDADVPQVLVGDDGRLRQVVVNLVGNAIKFTAKGEVVLEVSPGGADLQPGSSGASVQVANGEQVTLLVSVRDTGIGIPRDKQPRVFEKFQQADSSTTRTFGGSGLGLAISARLVELMGGTIGLESEPGRGSRFYFTARFGVSDAAPQRSRECPVVLADLPVLVVDDNATNRRILLDVLSNWGLRPSLASGAQEAFDQLRAAEQRGEPFRLALLDVNMPQVDGFELAAWIRDSRSDDVAQMPLVMLTSAGQPGDAERRDALRIAAHLLKPAKQSELFDAIVSAVGFTATEPETPPAGEAAALPELRPLHVLLAEDNLVNQRLAVGILERLGCRVTVADNGRKAVASLETDRFDVVLMDVQMPEMDGFEATRAIRRREQATSRHTPIIAMTAHAMTGDRDRCLEAGMDDYLSKPVRLRQVAEKLSGMSRKGDAHPPSDPAQEDPSSPDTSVHLSRHAQSELIDWAGALEAAGGDRDLLQTVIDAFREESAVLMPRLRAAVEQRDAAALGESAHALKGALLSIGARSTASRAFELERLASSANLDDCGQPFAALEQQMAALSSQLTQRPAKPS